MAFKRKKIQSAATVGSRLLQARRKKDLSIDQVEEATKVRAKYLHAIESGNWNEFPSRIYVYGFVKRYAEFLGLDSNKILEDFRTEFGSNRINFLAKKSTRLIDQIIITPRFLVVTFVVLVFAFLVGYIFFSAEKVARPPAVEIISPKDEITKKGEILIEGKTANTAIVEINGQLVPVDDKGYFKQKITLNEGVNIFDVKAKNRLGREEIKQIKILKTK